eukprot:CAMPEP_0197626944 /NCGR_PEP_ID=MMETSP1338-20131121/5703_1 /TAXON_ID=43686 ORGANISM="Pelagodinium beii, Strain RCC1491" /NCGR_SAMPLE_ID=MMETSP1338 /ASSEMBLY_ACC=CAM_ASM_000754 /LENGTH=315 /DNA_ID=CAMNT_0043197543 /DNA_START=81 /DNA_END=1028 /DNA_ORIENTATION=+
MGVKAAGAYVFTCFFAALLTSVGCVTPWHSTRFSSAFFVLLFQMKTGLLFTKVTLGAGDLGCALAGKSFCNELEDGISLQSAKEHFCAPAVVAVLPMVCDPFASAFVLGFILVLVIGINFIVLVISSYLLYCYFTAKQPKPQYRRAAAVLHVGTTGTLLVAIIVYSVQATARLDSLGGGGIPGLAQSTLADGTEWGAIITFVALMLQILAGFLFFWIPAGSELTEDDILTNQMLKESQRGEMLKLAATTQGPSVMAAPTYGAMGGWGQAPFAPQQLQPQPVPFQLPPAVPQQPPPPALPPAGATFQPGTPNNPAW